MNLGFLQSRKNHPPVEIVRQQYTAKFVYLDKDKKQIGAGLDRYDSVEGYENGVADVISNMANLAAHRGKVRHVQKSDLFSVLMKCHDPSHEIYFLSLSRGQCIVSSYTDDEIRRRANLWADSVPEMEWSEASSFRCQVPSISGTSGGRDRLIFVINWTFSRRRACKATPPHVDPGRDPLTGEPGHT